MMFKTSKMHDFKWKITIGLGNLLVGNRQICSKMTFNSVKRCYESSDFVKAVY